VRSLQRGLAILRFISCSGGIKAGEIAERIGVARPTVYRLLETLEEEGYVVRSASDNRFRVTHEATALGAGYDTVNSISQVAGPVLVELGHRYIWPFDLSVCVGTQMQIQESTHPRSPLAKDRGVIRRHLPMLHTAAGRSYLAFCTERERLRLVDNITAHGNADDRYLLKGPWLDTMVVETAARGYAVRYNDRYNPHTSSIAVPIFSGTTLIGSIAVIWITKALTLAEGVDQFFATMRDAAVRINSLHGHLHAAE
jgi:IclR family mhp operon transcriptional activator